MPLQITPDERAALQWLAEGKGYDEIAGRLETTNEELEVNLSALFRRLGVSTPADAVRAGAKRGLLDLALPACDIASVAPWRHSIMYGPGGAGNRD